MKNIGVDPQYLTKTLQAVRAEFAESAFKCPACNLKSGHVDFKDGSSHYGFELCPHCYSIWIHQNLIEHLPKIFKSPESGWSVENLPEEPVKAAEQDSIDQIADSLQNPSSGKSNHCPQCEAELNLEQKAGRISYRCDTCEKVLVSIAALRNQKVDPDLVKAIWQQTKIDTTKEGENCPLCVLNMSTLRLSDGSCKFNIDVCSHCRIIWLDDFDYESLPREESEPEAELSLEAQKLMAHSIIESQKNQFDGLNFTEPPDSFGKMLLGLLGLPVEYDSSTSFFDSRGTWMLAGTLVILFFLSLADYEAIINALAFIPEKWYRIFGLSIISSGFLHGSFVHLFGNTYYLILFGDNVEQELGIGKYLLLLLTAHVAGTLLHGVFDPRPDLPVIGASAAVSGVMAYYALAFPANRIGHFIFLFFYFFWLRIPALLHVGFWVSIQIWIAKQQLAGIGHVSALGHLGGVIAGVAFAFIYSPNLNRK